jgi:nucleoside-diphosphate-sugar epimerase
VRDSILKANSILFVGCGDLGIRAGQLLYGFGHQLAGVCRSPETLPEYFVRYAADYSERDSLSFLSGAAPDYIVATLKPASYSAQGYRRGFPDAVRNLLSGLGSHRPKALVMVSSTRVYAERDGAWVDEYSPLETEGYAGAAIVEAERLLQASALPVVIVRFGGIYGALPSRALERVSKGEFSAPGSPRFSNRIHRDDCAGFIAHLLAMPPGEWAPIYTAVDNEPVVFREVEQWLAHKLGVDYPVSQQRESGPATGKRCRNASMRESGYQLRYPGYREGYSAMLDASQNPEDSILRV